MKRRQFIKSSVIGTAGVSLSPFVFNQWDGLKAQEADPQVVWVDNGEPADLFQRAMTELGGLEKFIKKGDVVVIKPNIGWDRPPELAATTNPDLIAAITRACKTVGAKEVKIFDRTCNNARRCYRSSKIQEMADAAGADVSQIRDTKYKSFPVNGSLIKEWPIYSEYLEADKVINVPIAKHHSLCKVTLGLKNLMGVMGGNRGSLHNNFSLKLAEINKHILPTLTIIDAYRILIDNGPIGGNPDHVRLTKTLVASDCTVSADFASLELFGHSLDEVEYIKIAAQQGLAKYDLANLNIKKIKLS